VLYHSQNSDLCGVSSLEVTITHHFSRCSPHAASHLQASTHQYGILCCISFSSGHCVPLHVNETNIQLPRTESWVKVFPDLWPLVPVQRGCHLLSSSTSATSRQWFQLSWDFSGMQSWRWTVPGPLLRSGRHRKLEPSPRRWLAQRRHRDNGTTVLFVVKHDGTTEICDANPGDALATMQVLRCFKGPSQVG
jgi:hypothetical protein